MFSCVHVYWCWEIVVYVMTIYVYFHMITDAIEALCI